MNKRQEKLRQLKMDIIRNEEEDLNEYYGIVECKYNDITKYIDELDNLSDKLALTQWSNNNKMVKTLIDSYDMSDYEKNKYDKLLSYNEDLNKNLNIELLSEKYDFLNDNLDFITTSLDAQQQILSMSDERLELFKILYKNINDSTKNSIPFLDNILKTIGSTPFSEYHNQFNGYDELTDSIAKSIKNSNGEIDFNIDKLLYLYNSPIRFNVNNLEDLDNLENNIKDNCESILNDEKQKKNKNIKNIKTALLVRSYGINYNMAENICKTYDLSGINKEENEEVIEMYKAIFQIVVEKEPETLINVFDDFNKQHDMNIDYRSLATFENDLREVFSRDINEQVLNLNKEKIEEKIEGIPLYNAGNDFKMVVTAPGAYNGRYESQDNYKEYWNSPSIISHGNCCSLIANNNLSTAKVKNILLGFSSMDESMLLLSGERDINSTPLSKNFNTTATSDKKFMSPNNLINNTRADYNELVYERRDLTREGENYKKNPDYLVFIEEYENLESRLKNSTNEKERELLLSQKQEEENKFKETLKAAKDFDIPIVKINRETCAKSELSKIEANIEEYRNTHDSTLINDIIMQFENNRVGNSGNHSIIREEYFSEEIMQKKLKELYSITNSILSPNIKSKNFNALEEAIKIEENKINKSKTYRKNNQKSGFDFKKEIEIIKNMQINERDNLGEER